MATTRSKLARTPARIDGIDADIAALDAQIETELAPFAAAARPDGIPAAGHLCSWAQFSPGIKSSAGKTKGRGSTGRGGRYLARVHRLEALGYTVTPAA